METLLEDYKRKLKNIKELIKKNTSNGSILHQRREERLNTKSAEYRTFIVDIERAIERQKQSSANRYSLKWGNTPHNLNMVFISDMVDSPQKAIDEFYECYPDSFCDHPKPYNI
jgi:hypothetical protein